MSEFDTWVQRGLRAGPLWLWAPPAGASTIPNLGSADNGLEATLVGDARLVDDGLIPGMAAVSLDGSGYIDTGVGTRTNLVLNPSGAVDTTGWLTHGDPSLWERVAALPGGGWPGGVATGFHWIVTSGSDGVRTPIPMTAGKTYRMSSWVRRTAGTGQIRFRLTDASGSEVAIQLHTGLTEGGDAVRKDLTYTAARTETHWFRVESGTGPFDLEVHFTAVLIEESATLGDFFPTPAQLASRLAGFSGTAHVSASDIGPFARGTDRSWSIKARRADTAAAHTLLGSSDSVIRVQAASGSNDVTATFDNAGTTVTWTDALPDLDQALVTFRLSGTTATLDVNGVDQGARTVVRAQVAGNLLLGAHGAGSDPFHGSLLPFAIYGRALTEEEIWGLYDVTSPRVSITAFPDNPTAERESTFEFEADEASSFEYQLDSGAWVPTASPLVLRPISIGDRTLTIKGIDRAGNEGFDTYSWTRQLVQLPLATPHPETITPKLGVPFTIAGDSASVVEQDSDDEVVQCVAAILRTRKGTRPDDPRLGLPDFAFRQGGADLEVIRATLAEYEPRASTLTDQELIDLLATVSLDVHTTTEETHG